MNSIASYEGAMLVAGSPTLVWAKGATRETMPLFDRTGIGVLREPNGTNRLVPNPLPGAEITYPRVASAGRAGWHVLWVVPGKQHSKNPIAVDTGAVWYGLFDGHQWQQVAEVTQIGSAHVFTGAASELVVTKTGLAFAYPFERPDGLRFDVPAPQGTVILRRGPTGWSADTLLAWDYPAAVQLTTTADGQLLAILSQLWFVPNEGVHGPSLFTVPFDDHWGAPRLALNVPSHHLRVPMVGAPGDERTTLAWTTATKSPSMAEPGMLEWGVLANGVVHPLGRLASVAAGERPAMIKLDTRRTAWFVRNGESRDELRAFVTQDSTTTDVGVFHVPVSNFVTLGAMTPDGALTIITGKVGTVATDPFFAMYVTSFTVRCPAVRR